MTQDYNILRMRVNGLFSVVISIYIAPFIESSAYSQSHHIVPGSIASMLSFIYLALVGSATLVGCMPHQFSLSLSLEGDTDALPYQQSPQILAGTSPPAYIVPLSKYARVGKVDVDVEEGTIALCKYLLSLLHQLPKLTCAISGA